MGLKAIFRRLCVPEDHDVYGKKSLTVSESSETFETLYSLTLISDSPILQPMVTLWFCHDTVLLYDNLFFQGKNVHLFC
jgi:hypothetical protein